MFIELSRRFRELNANTGREAAALQSYVRRYGPKDGNLDWTAILKFSAVVILGEPGSGKTWEFREQASKLQEQGLCALFVRLDGLLIKSFKDTLSAEDEVLFQRWRKSDERMILFLDSVDESKLTKAKDFFRAIEVVRREVGDHFFPRLQLVISSRISEWLPTTDADAVKYQFPLLCSEIDSSEIAAKSDTSAWDTWFNKWATGSSIKDIFFFEKDRPIRKSMPIKVVQIEPLDRSQVEIFTLKKIPNDPDLFLKALDEHFAWEFARRPIDVISLLKFWNEKRRLGSLVEIIEYQINESLKESPDRQADDKLDPNTAREGAQSLAAAAIFCRKLTFYVPDSSHPASDAAIDPALCLTSWSPKERASLLLRALFDSPSYGQIRFHHRRAVEYLAAEWLAMRLKEGYAVVDLEDLLFFRGHNGLLLRPSLAPIAAWLASSDEAWGLRIRQLILQVEPELFFRLGDPSKLPIGYKQALLECFCKKIQRYNLHWTEIEEESLSRLADPALTDYVSSIIRDSAQADPAREVMLQFVKHGRLSGCVDAILDTIEDNRTSDEIRLYAVGALRNSVNKVQLQSLAKIVAKLGDLRPELGIHFCTLLFPNVISPEELGSILRKISKSLARSTSWAWYLIDHFQKELSPSLSYRVLCVLTGLLKIPPIEQKSLEHAPRSVEFGWVRKLIPTVLVKVLEQDVLSVEHIATIYEAVAFLKPWIHHEDGREEDRKAINIASTKHSKLRQQIFWNQIGTASSKGGKKHYYNGFDYRLPFTPHISDWNWCIADIQNRPTRRQRVLAFNYSIDLWEKRKSRFRDLFLIYRQTAKTAACRLLFRRFVSLAPRRMLHRIINRLGLNQFKRKSWRQQLAHKMGEWYERKRAQWILLRGIAQIRNATAVGWLQQLVIEAHRNTGEACCTIKRWDHLEAKYGKWITTATKLGCIRFWRTEKPELPHERQSLDSIPNNLFVGLSGISLTFQQGFSRPSDLSREDALVAARYAMNELNEFPSWLKLLAVSHQAEVQEVLVECVRGEWRYAAEVKGVHGILARLKWQDEGLRPLVAKDIVNLLARGAPENGEVEELAYAILLKERNLFGNAIKLNLEQRIPLVDLSTPRSVMLLVVALQIHADLALEVLEQPTSNEEQAAKWIQGILATLGDHHGGRSLLISNPDYLRPQALYRLILLAYKYVNPRDDLSHLGSYTPTARDDAEQFRTNLLQRLADSDEMIVTGLLDKLVALPELNAHKAWLSRLIHQRELRLSDHPAWMPSDIELFQKEHESEPQRAQDLFKIVTSRLRDLKHSLEKSDNSLRSELQAGCKESELRRWVARKLQDKAMGRFTVPQEAVIDLEERPDIRIEHAKVGHVSIEIKWANSWTLAQLFDGLETQLVGRYLRAHNSNHGIFLVGAIGTKREWKNMTTGGMVNFDDVIALLEARAKELETRKLGIGLKVVSLDFRNPRSAY